MFLGYYDFHSDTNSYLYCILSIIAQGVYFSVVEHLALKSCYNVSELLYINSGNGVFFFAIFLFTARREESRRAIEALFDWGVASSGFWLSFVPVVFLGCVHTYVTFLCTTVNSALTTSVVGNVKAIFQDMLGFYLGLRVFHDISFSSAIIIGILCNLFGCILYAWSNLSSPQTNQQRDSQEKSIEPSSSKCTSPQNNP